MEELTSNMSTEGMEEGILGDGLEPGEIVDALPIDVAVEGEANQAASAGDGESDQTEGFIGDGVEAPEDGSFEEGAFDGDIVIGGSEGDNVGFEGEDMGFEGFEGEDAAFGGMLGAEVGEPASSFAPMSSYPFVIGMGVLAIALGVLFGVLLAKRRIKKGIEAYED